MLGFSWLMRACGGLLAAMATSAACADTLEDTRNQEQASQFAKAGGDRLIEAVASHQMPISTEMLESHRHNFSPPRDAKVIPARSATKDELVQAARTSVREFPWDLISLQNVLAFFIDERIDRRHNGSFWNLGEDNPDTRPKNPEILSKLVERQMELSDAQGEELLFGLAADYPGERRAFLPLIRRLANVPANSPRGLQMLVQLAPREARALVIDDILHPPFRHARSPSRGGPGDVDLEPLLCLPVGMVLPELDGVFRERLASREKTSRDEEIWATLPLIARYGSPALLPDVLAIYQPHEGRWACALQEAALEFWLRCDPPAGVAGLRRALALRKETHCYESALDVLHKQWTETAVPLVVAELEDESEGLALAAARLLAEHAPAPPMTEKMVSAAERLNQPYEKVTGERTGADGSRPAESVIELLLEKESWRLSRAHLVRLRGLTRDGSTSRARIDQRLAGAK